MADVLTTIDDLTPIANPDGTERFEASQGTVGAGSDGRVTGQQIADLSAPVNGECLLSRVDATNQRLDRFNGRSLVIDGARRDIPEAGVVLPVTGLLADTDYWVYAYMDPGMTLEASTTARAAHTDGTQIKSGDPTRALVGMGRPITGPNWVDTAGQRFVRTWFNDPGIALLRADAVGFTTTSQADPPTVEPDPSLRAEFLSWENEPGTQGMDFTFVITNSRLGRIRAQVDGVGLGRQGRGQVLSGNLPDEVTCSVALTGLSEGYHYASGFFSTSLDTITLQYYNNSVLLNGSGA